MWEKKHRLPRECYCGRVTVAFTACVMDRRTPFTSEAIVTEFLNSLRKALEKSRCTVLIYSFMPDHFHVIIRGLDEGSDTWRAMVDFKQRTGYWFSQSGLGFEWQQSFYDHIIREDEDLIAQIRYIADNPVRKGMATHWSEYPYTGAIGHDLQQMLFQSDL
jgi:REP element-mobilizing transposase RayT